MKKQSGHMRMLPVSLVAASVLVLGTVSSTKGMTATRTRPFAEAEVFFELNDTDGDLGIHASIDGEAWKQLEMTDPNDRRILNIRAEGRLRRQGLTKDRKFHTCPAPVRSNFPRRDRAVQSD